MNKHTILLAAVLSASAQAQVFVDDSAPAGGNGVSWATAYNDLNTALAMSGGSALIYVAEGTYRPSTIPAGQLNQLANSTFQVGPNVTLIGGFLGNETNGTPLGLPAKTILDGEVVSGGPSRARHVVSVVIPPGVTGTTRIERVKIIDGNATGNGSYEDVGAGILYTAPLTGGPVGGHSLELRDVRVRDCKADTAGAGIYAQGGTLNAYQCRLISNNAGIAGGGIYVMDHGSGELSQHSHVYNTLFRLNVAGDLGGGCMIDTPQDFVQQDPRVRFMNCVFDRNAAVDMGGGLHLGAWAASDIANCSFSGNRSGMGGGLSHDQGHGLPEIQTRIWNCISYGNTALTEPEFQTWYAITLQCSDLPVVIANNDLTNAAIGAPACGATIANNFYVDPLFLDPANGNLHISTSSFCVNTGTQAFVQQDYFDADGDGNVTEPMPFDYDGTMRIKGSQIDRGAFEPFLPIEPQ
jgi:hypothetical protein